MTPFIQLHFLSLVQHVLTNTHTHTHTLVRRCLSFSLSLQSSCPFSLIRPCLVHSSHSVSSPFYCATKQPAGPKETGPIISIVVTFFF
ncbi:hypothetical protein BKA57DRAFT_466894 [Linnemannia elongata]|nr:hypothetical protein BKA57DRAFT_466894 [Linnemannia elongata]